MAAHGHDDAGEACAPALIGACVVRAATRRGR